LADDEDYDIEDYEDEGDYDLPSDDIELEGGKWYGDGEGLVERERKSKRRKQLALSTILLLAAAISVWQAGYLIHPTIWVTEPAIEVDVNRYCNGYLDCFESTPCSCDGVWIYATYTRSFAVLVDTNGDVRRPYTTLALLLLLASGIAFVWAVLILPIGESKEKEPEDWRQRIGYEPPRRDGGQY